MCLRGKLAGNSDAQFPFDEQGGTSSGDGVCTKFCVLTRGGLSASEQSVVVKNSKDDMTKGREKSDDRVVPKGRRKAIPTGAKRRGGKAVTASEQAIQLEMLGETADSPKGADGETDVDRSTSESRAVPKSPNSQAQEMPAVTMNEVASEQNLRSAFKKVASNKGAPGPDGMSIEELRERFDDVWPVLSRKLLDGSYRPGNIRRVWIPKSGGGQRGLGIPNVIDRVVQQAVHNVLGPQFEPTFHKSSHGFRPGRSCHTAIYEAKRHLGEGFEWVVDLDLEKFFDKVNHQRLMARLEQKVADRRLLRLIHQMLKAGVVLPDGVVVSTDEGVPQGGPLSPLLSNVVLDELDRELERRGHRFVRYADDCNIYVSSERAGHRVMASIVRFIESRLRLKVNAEKSSVSRPEQRHFLGFSLRREPLDGSIEVALSQRSRRRIREKVRELTPRTWGQSLRDCIDRISEYLLGWIGYFRICSVQSLEELSFIDAHIRRRLRAIVLRHWRRRRNKKLRFSTGHRGWWPQSISRRAHKVLPVRFFAERGLVSLEEEWRRRKATPATAAAASMRALRAADGNIDART
jgi:group II intron reverse transcriptase/maturase